MNVESRMNKLEKHSRSRQASGLLSLHADEPIGPFWHNGPVADLTTTPGDAAQRLVDFLVSTPDQPRRICDW